MQGSHQVKGILTGLSLVSKHFGEAQERKCGPLVRRHDKEINNCSYRS